ncbi:hypothetical protein Glove_242g14 [Diversispora epigaea]|uniref:Uncharacterized protein n=1 Tax=Diversispora epigaea TaxID=1348612 RepID=A0A397IA95_9GLOM|nr:hypothetical protein Glove_242g14 [Diversispora epigaea]
MFQERWKCLIDELARRLRDISERCINNQLESQIYEYYKSKTKVKSKVGKCSNDMEGRKD